MPRQKMFTDSKTIQVVLESSDRDVFTEMCYAAGTTPVEYLRQIVLRKIKENKL
jgi:hypothetical protein